MLINEKVKYACRILVGAAFVASAILKFISLDAFELYIYGFDWFGMGVSSYLARLILTMEMLMGLSLISGVKAKMAVQGAMAALLVFSLFLIYLIATGNDGNCHCFGEQFELKPLPSLGKNVVMMAMLAIAWNAKDWFSKICKYILPLFVAGSLIFSLVLKAPYGYGADKPVRFSPDKFAELVESHPDLKKPGKQVVAFFSTHCKHCKSAMRKLEIALRRNHFSQEKVQWFVIGQEQSFQEFLAETGVSPCRYELMAGNRVLNITDGSVPLILLLKDGEVVGKLSNATFNEGTIHEFCESGQ